MENLRLERTQISCLKTLLRRGDLKDIYLSVHVHNKSSQMYLCSQWRSRYYAFQDLPFGLNTAPKVITKQIKPIAAYLRKRSIRIILHLFDFLILGSSIEEKWWLFVTLNVKYFWNRSISKVSVVYYPMTHARKRLLRTRCPLLNRWVNIRWFNPSLYWLNLNHPGGILQSVFSIVEWKCIYLISLWFPSMSHSDKGPGTL